MNKAIILVAICAIGLALPSYAGAYVYSDFSVFGDDKLSTGTNVVIYSGMAGSNANVNTLGGGSSTKGLAGGGTFGSGTNILVDGNLVFNGNVQIGGGGHIKGNVDSGGAITTGTNVIIDGNATAASTITLGGGSSVGGATTQFGTPISYTTVLLPAFSVFSAGTTDITTGSGQTTNLAAGSYKNVNLGTNNILNLTSGDYYFNILTLGGGSDINLNLTSADIRIFLVGDLALFGSVDMILTGGTAKDVYVEGYSGISFGGGSNVFGTFYAASDVIVGNNVDMVGALYSGRFLTFGGGSTMDFQLADYLSSQQQSSVIPEPATMALFAIGLSGIVFRRRHKILVK